MIWSGQQSGGRPLGRRHDEGGLEARMSMAWVSEGDSQYKYSYDHVFVHVEFAKMKFFLLTRMLL